MNYFVLYEIELSYIDIFEEIHRSIKTWTEKEFLFDVARERKSFENPRGKRAIKKIMRRCVLNRFEPYHDLKHLIELVDAEYDYAFHKDDKRKFTIKINLGDKNDIRKLKLKYPKWYEVIRK